MQSIWYKEPMFGHYQFFWYCQSDMFNLLPQYHNSLIDTDTASNILSLDPYLLTIEPWILN